MDYLDFEPEIGLGEGREYPVAVVRSSAIMCRNGTIGTLIECDELGQKCLWRRRPRNCEDR